MSVRNLDSLFRPKSVALIGASAKPGTVGAVVARNLLHGFGASVMLVNSHDQAVEGWQVYPNVASLPQSPDLAVIATPPETVPGLIADLGARGTRAAVVITAGFSELGERGKALHQAMLNAARPHLLRIVGPNCVGILAPHIGLNASFSHLDAAPGGLAFVSQSGAMITAVLDWAKPRGIGFSHVLSLGDMSDVDFGDVIEYLATDRDTKAILLYIEGITNARKFLAAASAASVKKPMVAVKVGKHAESARAAASHTGALAGVDAVYDAAFRRTGILRVQRTEEMFDAVETLAATGTQAGDRLAILTNGGGPGVLAADALLDDGGRLAELSTSTVDRLNAVLPRIWSRANPVDIIGDANGERYRKAVSILIEDGDIDAILILNCPTGIADSVVAAQAVIDTIAIARSKPDCDCNFFTSWLGGYSAEPARRLFEAAGIATYETPDRAVSGFLHRVAFDRIQELAHTASLSSRQAMAFDGSAGSQIVKSALTAGRSWLDVIDVAELFRAYGIPMVETRIAKDPDEAAEIAQAMGFPVVLKIRSPDVTHKTDVGGVTVDIATADMVRTEAKAMSERVAATYPDARQKGFIVQKMIQHPDAIELIVGVSQDATFGPIVMFGQGGIAVEALKDTSLELVPIDKVLALAQIERTRVSKLLHGVRNRAAANMDAIADTLVRISRMVSENPEIDELDINPLLATANGVLALDGRVLVRQVPK